MSVPLIPESAPFSAAQRAWLNGFLAGLYSHAETLPATAISARNIAVLFASQTGTSERLAKKIAKELKTQGHTARVASLENYAPAALATEECAVILASTYGEGDPPDAARGFFDQLCDEGAPRLEKLNYAVLALGDSHYEHFCKFAFDLEERLSLLGAKPLCATVTCDVDVDEPFDLWKRDLFARLTQATNEPSSTTVRKPAAQSQDRSSLYHRDNPFQAPLVDKMALTQDVSSKLTLHLAFSLEGSGLQYVAGDALGVIAKNDPALVDYVLEQAKLQADDRVTLPKLGDISVLDALVDHLQLTKLSRKLVDAYARAGQCPTLLGLLKPEQQTHFDEYIYGRGVLDLLLEYPGVIADAQQLVDLLPKLAPRLYSISSSPSRHTGEVHATVAVVRYRSHNLERGGVCSTMFADRTALGGTVPVYIQQNKKFRLPDDGNMPVVMVGPGTGIAPFRGFLHERIATGAAGKNWLFFGERSAATDFLYREELETMKADGSLTRLDTAFSRDQVHKIYVQDRMLEQGAELYAWLQQGARFYVCGDATRMAKDVDAALHKVIEVHGGLDQEAAKEYVQQLHDQARYLRDVY